MKIKLLTILTAFLLLAMPAVAVEEFHAYLDPPLLVVPAGADIQISFVVDTSAHEFNGYEVTLKYRPEVLTFLGAHEGSLMTGACPDRFRYLTTPTDSTVDYAHAIFCNGVSLDGPGILSTYDFHVDQVGECDLTIVSDPDRTFYDAGFFVWPQHPTYPRQVIFRSTRILVYDPADVPTAELDRPRDLAIRIQPNPSAGTGRATLKLPADSEWTLRLIDVSGREVNHWLGRTTGGREVELDIDASNRSTAPTRGVYFLRLDANSRSTTSRWVVSH